MSKASVVIPVSLLMTLGMVVLLVQSDRPRIPQPTAAGTAPTAGAAVEISLFCAASNRGVMEPIRERYERETGRRVAIQYGASDRKSTRLNSSHT